MNAEKNLKCLALANLVVQPPRKQPAHPEHVDGGTESAIAQAVIASTEAAWTMIHGDFDQPIICAFDERRDEAVHPFKWNQRAHAFEAHRLQRATRVAHTVFCETAANGVGDPRCYA